jgi:hypothetical protein
MGDFRLKSGVWRIRGQKKWEEFLRFFSERGFWFDEGGLHADFQDAPAAAIHQTGAGTQAVGVAAADDAVTGDDKAGVAGRAGGVVKFDQGGGDADGAAIEGQAGADGVEAARRVVQQSGAGGVEGEVTASAGKRNQTRGLIGANGVCEGLGEIADGQQIGDEIGGAGEALHSGVDAEGGAGGAKSACLLERPDGGIHAGN